MNCPKCSENAKPFGSVNAKKRWKCSGCGYQFTKTSLPGKPLWVKLFSVWLYSHRMSLTAIAKLFNVSTPAVLFWVRDFSKTLKKPKVSNVKSVQIDEVCHFIGEKNENSGSGLLLIAIQSKWLTGRSGLVVHDH